MAAFLSILLPMCASATPTILLQAVLLQMQPSMLSGPVLALAEANPLPNVHSIRSSSSSTTLQRILNDNNNNNQHNEALVSLLRDSKGIQYNPDAIAWRYLGMYVDCDVQEVARDFSPVYEDTAAGDGQLYFYDDDQLQQQDGGNNNDDNLDELTDWYRRDRRARRRTQEQRRFLNGEGSQDQTQRECSRKLLWAAYHDPHYQGGQISEYAFYDFDTGQYDTNTCGSSSNGHHHHRCARMDCHEPNTHFELIGVYKESDGFMDWAEQLFQHHGSCLWHQDQDHANLEILEDSLETIWPVYCRRLYYPSQKDGSILYMDVRPESEGNLTVGVYRDNRCVVPSTYSFEDYILMYYDQYGSSETGVQVAATWASTISTWNEYMRDYKVCQPCRSYSINSAFNNNDNRFLEEEDENANDDGNGDDYYDGDMSEEQSGFNCYDDAGTTNANQVSPHKTDTPRKQQIWFINIILEVYILTDFFFYLSIICSLLLFQCKLFATETDLEMADANDLARAHEQKSILRIKVDGVKYGKGAYRGPLKLHQIVMIVCLVVLVGIVGALFLVRKYRKTTFVRNLMAKTEKVVPLLFWRREELDPKEVSLSNQRPTRNTGSSE